MINRQRVRKTIVITGASRGIGYETARSLAEFGHTVIAISRSEEGLIKLRESVQGEIIIMPMDLTKPRSVYELTQMIKNEAIALDGVIHNAGLLISKPFSELTDLEWQNQWELNVMVPVRLTRELLPYLKHGSHIVHIGSMGGYQGSSKFPGLTAYSATKAALAALAESLSAELVGQNISSNCLCLGAVQTEMLQQAFPGYKAPVLPQKMGEFISNFTLNGHQFMNGKVLPVALNNPD